MTWTEYKTLRKAGKLRAGIDQSVALGLVKYLPTNFQAAHAFWSWVWMLSIPGFICVAIFVKWWVGLLFLVFGTPAIFRATKQSAAQFVLQHAEADEQFFNRLTDHNLLDFRE